jgi:hypothetical protein
VSLFLHQPTSAEENVEQPEGARGSAGEKRGGAAYVDATFDDVAGDLLVFEALGEKGEALETCGADHGVAANEASEAVIGEARAHGQE